MTTEHRNMLIGGAPNRIDQAALTAGSEATGLEIENIQSRRLRKVWRTANDTAANTWYLADFGTTRAIGLVSHIGHNLSQAGLRRIRLSAYSAFDAGFVTGTGGYLRTAAVMSTTADVAISFFVRRASVPAGVEYLASFGNGTIVDNTNSDWTLYLDTSGRVNFQLSRYSGLMPIGAPALVNVCDGEWHHVLFSINNSAGWAQLFIDGVEYLNGPAPAHSAQVNDYLSILGGHDGTLRSTADISDVSFWSVPKSAADYSRFTRGPLDGSETGLVDYYDMTDESLGDSTLASSGPGAHNLTLTSTATLDPDGRSWSVLYDSGWQTTWPAVSSFGTLDWGVFTWGGVIEAEVADSLILQDHHLVEPVTVARYMLVEFDDEDNPDGYIEVGRVVAGPVFSPTANFSWGSPIEVIDPSVVSRTPYGQVWVDRREPYRRFDLSMSGLTTDEVGSQLIHWLGRIKGQAGDLVLILDPSDPENWHHLACYCRVAGSVRVSPGAVDWWEGQVILEELVG